MTKRKLASVPAHNVPALSQVTIEENHDQDMDQIVIQEDWAYNGKEKNKKEDV
jgi:hypothetical protein